MNITPGFTRFATAGSLAFAMMTAAAPADAQTNCRWFDGRQYCEPRRDIGTDALGLLGGLAIDHALRSRPQPRRYNRCYDVDAFNRDGTRYLGKVPYCD